VNLDYFRHLISRVDVARFDYSSVDWDLSDILATAKDQFYRITLEQHDAERIGERAAVSLETDDQVKAWLVANLPFDYFSHKQLRLIVGRVMERLREVNRELIGKLALVKFVVREKLAGFVEHQTDIQCEAGFKQLFETKRLCFYLECLECRFEIPETVKLQVMRQLARDNGDVVRRSLFDYTPDNLNEYEKSVALYLDEHPQVLWWYRNLVGPENFSIQGYQRHPIYPDFVVQEGEDAKPVARVLVVESKGKQLKGSLDTNYKRNVARYFEKVGHQGPRV
jgi:hypothetical protein